MEIINHLPDFVIVVGEDGSIVEWNEQAVRDLGYSRREALGSQFNDLLIPDAFAQQSIEMLRTQLQERAYWEGQVRFRLGNGEQSWFFVRARTITLEGVGKATMIVNTYLIEYEVHHRIAQAILDRSQREFNSILSAVGDTVCSYNLEDDSLMFISPSCVSLTGYTDDELMDNPQLFWDILTPPYRETVEHTLRNTPSDETIKIEYSLQHKDGDIRWVLNSVTPVADAEGRPDRIICVITDTTAYRELNELKSRMMRMASHDLRNPLSIAIGFAELLETDLAELLDEAQRGMFATIHRSHNRMIMMLKELLQYEQLANPAAIQWEVINLAEMVDQIIEEFVLSAERKQHQIVVEKSPVPLWVNAEWVQLRHALGNYVSNAIKYTPTGGRIIIRLYEQHDRVFAEVTDNGLGIPEQYRDQLFQAFFRAKQPGTENIDGTGIGLSLIKSVISNHGGDVFYRPEASGGSTFGFWLPMVK